MTKECPTREYKKKEKGQQKEGTHLLNRNPRKRSNSPMRKREGVDRRRVPSPEKKKDYSPEISIGVGGKNPRNQTSQKTSNSFRTLREEIDISGPKVLKRAHTPV